MNIPSTQDNSNLNLCHWMKGNKRKNTNVTHNTAVNMRKLQIFKRNLPVFLIPMCLCQALKTDDFKSENNKENIVKANMKMRSKGIAWTLFVGI